jgi:hypothetical protein
MTLNICLFVFSLLCGNNCPLRLVVGYDRESALLQIICDCSHCILKTILSLITYRGPGTSVPLYSHWSCIVVTDTVALLLLLPVIIPRSKQLFSTLHSLLSG